jgi:hypothetical protein
MWRTPTSEHSTRRSAHRLWRCRPCQALCAAACRGPLVGVGRACSVKPALSTAFGTGFLLHALLHHFKFLTSTKCTEFAVSVLPYECCCSNLVLRSSVVAGRAYGAPLDVFCITTRSCRGCGRVCARGDSSAAVQRPDACGASSIGRLQHHCAGHTAATGRVHHTRGAVLRQEGGRHARTQGWRRAGCCGHGMGYRQLPQGAQL